MKVDKTPMIRWLQCLLIAPVSMSLMAQEAPNEESVTEEDVYTLSPFEVSTDSNVGYLATETLAGTRIRTDLGDVASAIQVVTQEFINDVGATDNESLLQYLTNSEIGGSRGTYFGGGNGKTVHDGTSITGNNRLRGLSSADGTRDYFLSNIPWDSFNIERLDVQRGPNAILFGLGSPAGIINAGTKDAQYNDFGSLTFRIGSYGSMRGAIDYNEELIDGQLAVRVDGLVSNQRYQQKPTFKDDKRIYTTLKWDPQLFDRDFATSIKFKFESGKITANMPRTTTPYDNITPWFESEENGGAGKYTVGYGNRTLYDLGSTNLHDWTTYALGAQTPGFFIEGNTGLITNVYSGYIKNGFLNNDGSKRDNASMAIGQFNPWPLIGMNNYGQYAQNVGLPNSGYGIYKNKMLTDSSVFNFYKNLIDGDNKRESAEWTAFNVDFSQSFWGDRVALNLVYDHQEYNTDNWDVLGSAPAINIDITETMLDNSANPNYGRAFVSAGTGGGNWSKTEREGLRASLFAELRAEDVTENSFLKKLFGKQRFNVVGSQDTYKTESRNYALYAKTAAWDELARQSSTPNTIPFDERAPTSLIYLGQSLASENSASGANLSRITGNFALEDSYIYLFDSTWNARNIDPAAAWTPASTYELNMFDPVFATTQASNLDNYVGWTREHAIDLLSYRDGDELYTSASKSERVVKSLAGSWQGFLWNEAIVPTLGWRYDEVKTRYVNAERDRANRSYLRLGDEYSLPEYTEDDYYKGHSVSGGLVVHLNKVIPESWNKHVPLNVSVSYNESSNFQVSNARVDLYGNPISNPSGDTREYGVQLATKDGKYSFRAIKYKTAVANAYISNNTGFNSTIAYGVWWNNVFRYQLGAYGWGDRVKADNYGNQAIWTNPETGNDETITYQTRWYWTPAYVKDGRPVQTIYADLYDQSVPDHDYKETWDQAIARRDACMDSWNEIFNWLEDKGYFEAWNWQIVEREDRVNRSVWENGAYVNADGYLVNDAYTPSDTTRVNQQGGTVPSGFTIIGNMESEGYEFELTANPLPNWRIAINASKTTAMTTQIGDDNLLEFIDFMDEKMNGAAGDMRRWNGDAEGLWRELRGVWNGFKGDWALLTLTQYTAASELRKWRYNIVTSYDFTDGILKNFGVGGAYRWQDKVVIGYPFELDDLGQPAYNIDKPIYGPSEDGLDLWINYERDLNKKIHWKVQLNVSNAFQNNGLIPISVEPDGTTWAGVRMRPVQEWQLTNTFSF